PADLVGPAAGQVQPADYPGRWGEVPLSYEFAPGEPGDGVTADIPLAALAEVSGDELGWQVPGRREELVTELIRSLPKDLRRGVVAPPGQGPRRGARACPRRPRPARWSPGWASHAGTCWTRSARNSAASPASRSRGTRGI